MILMLYHGEKIVGKGQVLIFEKKKYKKGYHNNNNNYFKRSRFN